jgi:hypothetical protein
MSTVHNYSMYIVYKYARYRMRWLNMLLPCLPVQDRIGRLDRNGWDLMCMMKARHVRIMACCVTLLLKYPLKHLLITGHNVQYVCSEMNYCVKL